MVLLCVQICLSLNDASDNEVETSHQCGNKGELSLRIFYGREATVNDWPWLASLFLMPQRIFFCAGSIISVNRVLTAAHCIYDKKSKFPFKPEQLEVHLGKHRLSVQDENGSTFFIPSKIFLHPDWKVNSDRWEGDIAVLISSSDIKFKPNIQPVCLFSQSDESYGKVGMVVGWGKSQNRNIKHEDVPNEISVTEADTLKSLLENPGFTELLSIGHNFFVKGLVSGSGPCNGDSGKFFTTKEKLIYYYYVFDYP